MYGCRRVGASSLELLHSSTSRRFSVVFCFLVLRVQRVAESEQTYFRLVQDSAQDCFEVAHPAPHRFDFEEVGLVITADEKFVVGFDDVQRKFPLQE